MSEIEPGQGRTARAFRPRLPFAIAALALLLVPSFAPAATYGEVDVTIKNEPRGNATHGYVEIEFLVVNRSAQATHDVRITYPKSSYGSGSDYLRAVSRTVTVEAGKSARVSLAFPERLQPYGNGAGIAIDGREQEEGLPVRSGSSPRSSYGGYGYGYGSRGYGRVPLLILYSKSVDTRFPDWMGMPFRSSGSDELVRSDQDAKEWGTNWLGYTRYDGIVLTGKDLKEMPPEVHAAIGQYVECGGSLVVLGYNLMTPLPGGWKLQPDRFRAVSVANPGFGQCIATGRTDFTGWPNPEFPPILESWNVTARPWQRVREPNEANRAFSVVDDVGVPVKGLLALMFVFAIVIGPINLVVLARKKRKLWLFWTVPLISFVTCLTVVVYMAFTEGWKGQSRVEGFTVLDENSRRASSIGWTGFYTPLVPRGGLHFSPETEIAIQNGDDSYSSYGYSSRGRRSSSALSMDWTRDQHLSSGWLTPRVPSHFALRKSELRRERMTITKRPDGPIEAVNGLGVKLAEFWYMDEAGTLYYSPGIPAGERVTLEVAKPGSRPTLKSWGEPKNLREVYAADWSGLHDWLQEKGPALLGPRTYLGMLEGSPFLDDGMPGASTRRTRSVVYGICKEGGDGG